MRADCAHSPSPEAAVRLQGRYSNPADRSVARGKYGYSDEATIGGIGCYYLSQLIPHQWVSQDYGAISSLSTAECVSDHAVWLTLTALTLDSKQTALITGGSQGMGKAVAKSLAKKGANVIIVARDEKKLKKALEEVKVS